MRPMLAKPYKDSWVKYPVYLQPKLDGVRALWTGQRLLSRTGKEIKGVPALVEYLHRHFQQLPLDGELYNHNKTFQKQLSSIRKTVNIDEDLTIGYHLYDIPVENVTFEQRFAHLERNVVQTERLRIVHTLRYTQPVQNLNIFESMGYEGTMLRNANGLYTPGKRSSDLLKIKNFMDDEFEIVGVLQLSRKEKIIVPPNTPGALLYADNTWKKDGAETFEPMIGAIRLKLPDGRTFDAGTGFDEATRYEFWRNPPIGKIATIKFQELTDTGIPRFPVFKAIRDDE